MPDSFADRAEAEREAADCEKIENLPGHRYFVATLPPDIIASIKGVPTARRLGDIPDSEWLATDCAIAAGGAR